ncbi:MAG: hypothetical protein L6Q81_12900 [Bacteroidia bacterium]|nr:hypothetical protein [Bacteroidia bacterium]
MKQEVKIIVSLIGAIVFGFIFNAADSGVRTSAHYGGVVLLSVIIFFVLKWLLGLVGETSYVKEHVEQKEQVRRVKSDLVSYQESKNSFKYFSNEKLLEMYHQFQNNKQENLDRLALEEELVDRGLIENSPMHEKLYMIKKKLME